VSRQRKRLEKFSPEELNDLLDSPSKRGLEQILRFDLIPNTVTTPVDTALLDSTPVDTIGLNEGFSLTTPQANRAATVSTPVDTIPAPIPPKRAYPIRPITSSPERSPVDTTRPVSTPVETVRVVSTPAQVFTALPKETEPRLFLSRFKKRLFRPLRASDAHTDGEERLYKFMWSQGRPAGEGTRLVAASMTVLGRALGRDDRNTRPLVESLIRKLSISIARDQDFHSGLPRQYFVYDYSLIQQRRQQAGLEWALKNKGIQLLTAADANTLAASEAQLNLADIVSTPVDTTPVDTIVLTPVETVVSTLVERPVLTPVESSALPYRGNKIEEDRSGTSSSFREVVEALNSEFTFVDDDATRQIVNGCRKIVADATDAEIAHFVRITAKRTRTMKNVSNPIGLLIRQVPQCFEGESFRRYRETEKERRAAEHEQTMSAAHQILADADAPENLRSWAHEVLQQT
jgi:hypothetical protein